MGSSGSMRAQIGTLIIATSGVQLANGFFNTLISLRVAIESFEATGRSRPQQLFRRLHVGRVALRTDHRAGWAHPRLRRLRWDGGRGDRDDAAAARTAVLAGPAGGRRLRLRQALHHNRELAQRKGPAGGARADLFDLHGRHVPRPRAGTALDWAGRDRDGRTVQRDRRSVRRGIGHGEHDAGRATPVDRRRNAALRRARARGAPVAVVVGALSGLISSSFYALVPAWMQDEGIARETIAMSMLVAVLGGLAFQVPIARLSDRFDRRTFWPRLALALRAPPSLWSFWT